MIAVSRIRGSLLLILLLIAASMNSAHAEQLCAPFFNGKVKQHVVATMLKAAKIGNLYRIDPSTSEVGFCVDSKFKQVKGSFKEIKGGIALEPDAVNNGQALLAIDAESVSASSAMVENVIKSEAFFDVHNHPEILFVSTGFEWLSDTEGVLSGKLTLRGVTRAVKFKVTLSDIKGNKVGDSDAIQIKITTAIKRSDFGMASMTSVVSDKVSLCMNVQAKKPHI
jgi:polyisoprenoid-binding protein YceI